MKELTTRRFTMPRGRWQRNTTTVAVAGLVVAGTAMFSSASAASTSPLREQLSATTSSPGGTVTVTVTGAKPQALVKISLDRTVVVSKRAAKDGELTATVALRARLATGRHTISAQSAGVGSVSKSIVLRSDWSQLQGGPEHTGDNPSISDLRGATVKGLSQLWHNTLDGAATTNSSSIGVSGGVIYIGSSTNSLNAVDATSGATLWSRYIDSDSTVDNSPAIVDGLVIFTTNNGELSALNASTGSSVWGTSPPGGDASPAVVSGVVYAGGTKLFAYDETTGTPLWSAPLGSGSASSAPAVDTAANEAVIGSMSDAVYAVNTTNGDPDWTFQTANEVVATPVIANGIVYVGDLSGNMYALNEQTGAVVWTVNVGPSSEGFPTQVAVAAGTVYATTAFQQLYAFDAATGHQVWSEPVNSDRAPIVANGLIYLLGRNSTGPDLSILNTANGATDGDMALPTNTIGSPTVINGDVYVGSTTGLYEYGLSD
jgi:outer membrane protein assembly factor BamB